MDYNHIGSINFFLLKEDHSLTLIDAGIDTVECWDFLLQEIDRLGFTVNDIDRILLTHHHEDHVGLVKRILNIKKVPIYVHREAIPRLTFDPQFLNMRYDFFQQLYCEMGCASAGESRLEKLQDTLKNCEQRKIDADFIELKQGDSIAGMRVIEMPGHSSDSIVFFDEERKWVFGGDLLLAKSSTNAIIDPDQQGNRPATLVQHVDSLKRLSSIDADIVFPGHQDLIYQHQEVVQTKLHRIYAKSEKLLSLIRSGVVNANDLAEAYYNHKYKSEFSLVISEIIGQLDLLEHEQKIEKRMMNGVWHYAVAD